MNIKNFIKAIFIGASALLLTGCNHGKGYDEQGIRDVWDLTMRVSEVNTEEGKLTVTFNRDCEGEELITGNYFKLYKKNSEEKWDEVPLITEVCWEDIAWIIKENDETNVDQVYKYLYGALKPGTYKIEKEITKVNENKDNETAIYSAEFDIEASSEGIDTPSVDGEYEVTNNNDGTFTFRVEGNPTTGYEWIAGEAGGVLKVTSDNGTYFSKGHGVDMVGVGGTYEFKITIDSKGAEPADLGYITYEYKRSWEDTPIKTLEINFVLAEDGQITCNVY